MQPIQSHYQSILIHYEADFFLAKSDTISRGKANLCDINLCGQMLVGALPPGILQAGLHAGNLSHNMLLPSRMNWLALAMSFVCTS